MDYFVGVDIGTTATKAVAFSPAGKVLAKHSISYPIHHPEEQLSEQNPNVILKAVVRSLSSLASQLPGGNPVLVSFSSAMHSLILVDKKDEPLTECIIWADNRASDIARALRNTERGGAFYQKTGVPLHAMSPLCKLIWFRNEKPELLKRAKKCIGIKEFVFQRFFGNYVVDTGLAAATGLLSCRSLQWDPEILDSAGIREDQLSRVVDTTHVDKWTPEQRERLERWNTTREVQETAVSDTASPISLEAFAQTAFVIGSSDGALANLGSGATIAGSMAVTIGTSGAVRLASRQPLTDPEMRTFCYHLTGQQFIIGGASNNGAVVIQWLKEKLLQDTTSSYEAFLHTASTVSAGSDGLLFLPYILGERAPLWNSKARGVFFGLDAGHTSAHLVRAAMEAVIYNMYAIGRILMEKQAVSVIYASGGFTESDFWLQLLTDVFALPVFVPENENSSALGAVMVGLQALGEELGTGQGALGMGLETGQGALGVGLGTGQGALRAGLGAGQGALRAGLGAGLATPVTFDLTKGKTFHPNAENHAIYVERFHKWQRIYELVKGEF
ncbi:Gluconokinase [Hypsibius exemplaris]|uniref:glycerol kinase n=1 Tax=Hypsibius exemplaris TaxID=2072580 RepID=A0A9X6N9C9_HYPEX|nr:Gluconokinase [Hypsibius exemplaris]